MRKLAHLYHPIVWYKCESLRMWFVILNYHKIFIFAVLERWLIYDCQTECSFVYLIFAVLLHKFNHAIFEVLASTATRRGSQNSKSRSRDHLPTPWPNFALCSSVPPVIYMHAIFEVCSFNRSGNMERSQNFKCRSSDLFPTPWPNFAFR